VVQSIQKNGKRDRKQRYRCLDCGHVFQFKRVRNRVFEKNLWTQYVHGNQTLQSLSKHYGISYKTTRKLLDNHLIGQPIITSGSSVVVMDTCYFGWGFGVMVFRDFLKRKNLYWKYLKHETIEEYKSGINYLKGKGVEILGIACDGKRGLFSAFEATPIQMCQFHQVAIVTRYITRNPKLEAGKELKILTHNLTKSSKTEFATMLNDWHLKWKIFLSEKTYNDEHKKWHYTHRRLRSAYRSLKTNLPFLFTYLEYPDLGIPNTTNSLEGKFSNLKTKIRIHAGIKKWRKIRIINEILVK